MASMHFMFACIWRQASCEAQTISPRIHIWLSPLLYSTKNLDLTEHEIVRNAKGNTCFLMISRVIRGPDFTTYWDSDLKEVWKLWNLKLQLSCLSIVITMFWGFFCYFYGLLEGQKEYLDWYVFFCFLSVGQSLPIMRIMQDCVYNKMRSVKIATEDHLYTWALMCGLK